MKLWTNEYEWIMAETAEEATKLWQEATGENPEEYCEFEEQSFPVRFHDEDYPHSPILEFNSIDELIDAGFKPGEICFCTE